jgi:pimeloyl-ACP methyl ester carboxylesterase
MATAVRAVVCVVVVVLVLVAALWVLQRRLIYFPDRATPPPARAVLPGAQDVVLHTSDGLELGAWLVRPRSDDLGVTLLVTPGNGGSRLGRAALAEVLSAKGITVLLLDYRGYGGNPGSPTEEGLLRDARAGLTYLREQFPGDPTVYFGESLGAAVATALAVEHPPAGLVLRSPFTSLPDVGQAVYPFLPVRLLLRDRFPVVELISRVTAPTVVIYGTEDRVVPPSQSQAVADHAPHVQTVVVPGADHNDEALFVGDELVAAVVSLAQRVKAG